MNWNHVQTAEVGVSDRGRRRLVNQIALRRANAHYQVVKARLRSQLDSAEMHGTDDALVATWQSELDATA